MFEIRVTGISEVIIPIFLFSQILAYYNLKFCRGFTSKSIIKDYILNKIFQDGRDLKIILSGVDRLALCDCPEGEFRCSHVDKIGTCSVDLENLEI